MNFLDHGNCKIKYKELFFGILIVSFLASYFIRYFTKIDVLYPTAGMILAGLVALFCAFLESKKNRKITYFLFFINLVCLFSLEINGNFPQYYVFFLFAHQGIGMIIYCYPRLIVLLKIYLYFLCVLFLYFAFFSFNPDEVLNLASKNYISIILLGLLSLVYCDAIFNNKKKPIGISIIVILLIFWTKSRGGEITIFSFMLLTFIFIVLSRNTLTKLYRVLMIAMLLIILFYFLNKTSFLAQLLSEEGRITLFKTYLNMTFSSWKSFVFGTPIFHDALFLKFGKNTHNTFLQIHAQFGIIPLTFVLFYIGKVIIYEKNKKSFLIVIVIICMIIRSMTDITSFSDIFDITWYYLFFNLYNYKKVDENKIDSR